MLGRCSTKSNLTRGNIIKPREVQLKIVLGPAAERQLAQIYSYICISASAEIALRYTQGILDRCEGLAEYPNRGTPRDDLRAGLRTIPFRRRVTIAYIVESDRVVIFGIHYAGQDIDASFQE